MQRRARRYAAGLTLAFAAATTAAFTMTATAAAADPIVVGSCATSVQGAAGTPVSLKPSAIAGIVLDTLRPLDPLRLIVPAVERSLDSLDNIPIGALPTGTGFITGDTIAGAVTSRLPLGVLVTPVTGALRSLCGVTVTGVNAVVGPVQDGGAVVGGVVGQVTGALPGAPAAPAPGPGSPSGGGTPATPGTPSTGGGTNPVSGMPPTNGQVGGGLTPGGVPLYNPYSFVTGRSPMAYYGGLPYARAGLYSPSPAVAYGGGVPGYLPRFGVLGSDGMTDGVQAAGHAEALGLSGGDKVAFPVLLAVLALSGVTAALVRSWVLRRAF